MTFFCEELVLDTHFNNLILLLLFRRKNNRSNSLERRKSGDGDSIINQSTVHGTASPNRRPTIFDVFRPRSKSDAKRQKELAKAQAGDKDSSASGSSTHSGSGIMHSMKAAMQHTIGQKSSESKSSSKYRDGSAHPHGGSDAQYYHTVTAVRRLDHAKSPMTKMMDLFRHRSNSATSEADKRKAVSTRTSSSIHNKKIENNRELIFLCRKRHRCSNIKWQPKVQ